MRTALPRLCSKSGLASWCGTPVQRVGPHEAGVQLPAGINVLVDPWLVGKLTFGGLDMIYAGSKRVARPEVGSAPAEGSSSRQSSRGGARELGPLPDAALLPPLLLSLSHAGPRLHSLEPAFCAPNIDTRTPTPHPHPRPLQVIGDLEQLANETDVLVLSQGIDDHAHRWATAGLAGGPGNRAWAELATAPLHVTHVSHARLVSLCLAVRAPLLQASQPPGISQLFAAPGRASPPPAGRRCRRCPRRSPWSPRPRPPPWRALWASAPCTRCAPASRWRCWAAR